jgi:hypothetical protein
MSKQYGETGFIPTVETVKREGSSLVFETIDPREETNIVSTEEGLKRKAEFMTEQQERTRELEEMF